MDWISRAVALACVPARSAMMGLRAMLGPGMPPPVVPQPRGGPPAAVVPKPTPPVNLTPRIYTFYAPIQVRLPAASPFCAVLWSMHTCVAHTCCWCACFVGDAGCRPTANKRMSLGLLLPTSRRLWGCCCAAPGLRAVRVLAGQLLQAVSVPGGARGMPRLRPVPRAAHHGCGAGEPLSAVFEGDGHIWWSPRAGSAAGLPLACSQCTGWLCHAACLSRRW